MANQPYRDTESKQITMILPARQSVLMPASQHPLTQLQVRSERPGKTARSRPVRRNHIMPLPPSWAEVPITEALIHDLMDIQSSVKKRQWSEVRLIHPVRFGYSGEQWRLLTAHDCANDETMLTPRAKAHTSEQRMFVPAVTELAVLTDNLTVMACDHCTGITVETLAFNGPDALKLLDEAAPNAVVYHPGWFEQNLEKHYAPEYPCLDFAGRPVQPFGPKPQ